MKVPRPTMGNKITIIRRIIMGKKRQYMLKMVEEFYDTFYKPPTKQKK